MKKILVIGSGGFVGSTLLPMLAANGSTKLILVDRRPISYALRESVKRLGAEVHEIKSDKIPAGPECDDVDVAVCLAGATSVDAALEDPAPAYIDNVGIAVQVGEWFRRIKTSTRLVYMSSDEVLGVSKIPLPEDAALHPTQPYAVSKAAAETILHNYRDVYGGNLVTLRSCNLVGTNQRPPKLIPVAVESLANGRAVPIHGTGEQLREWMSVADLCRAIILLLDSSSPSGIYQASTGRQYSVNQVIAFVAQALAIPVQCIHVADRRVQDECYAMDSTRLRALGWIPVDDPERAIAAAAISSWESLQLAEPVRT